MADSGIDNSPIKRVVLVSSDGAPDYNTGTEGYSKTAPLVADTLVKTGVGVVHTVTFSQNDAAPTAGTIIIYDNTAESGTQIFNWNVLTTTFMPFSVILDANFTTGLYVGFTTTGDVNVTVTYR